MKCFGDLLVKTSDILLKWTITSFGLVILWFVLLWIGSKYGQYKTKKKRKEEQEWLDKYYEQYPWKKQDKDDLTKRVKRDVNEILKGLDDRDKETKNE